MSILQAMRSIPKLYPFLTSYKEGTPIATSIDITNLCNLRCKHCYYFMKAYQKKRLTNEQWLKKIKWIKEQHPTIIHCTWVGGEPMLPINRKLVEKGIKVFPFNWIVTNGTFDMPKWENTAYFVSIDGTEEQHDLIRGKGTYQKIKKRISESPAEKIFIHTVMTSTNFQTITNLAEEWRETKVKGIKFSFYTPVVLEGIKDPLFLKPAERDKIIKVILKMKKEYGDFILMGKKEIELFKSENYQKVIDDNPKDEKNCLLKKGAVLSVDSNGENKYPCVMGEMDCSKCGCTIPYMLHAVLIDKDWESTKMLAKTFF